MLSGLPLVDGHCHPILAAAPSDREAFALAATEADVLPPAGVSLLDGPVGLAIRRWCAPVLDLPAGAPIEDYLDRRAELGPTDATAPTTRYGLALASKHLISALAASASVPAVPVTSRSAASRFSRPQHCHGPAHRCGTSRR